VSSISPKVILYLVGINDVLRSSENPGTTLPNNKHPYLLRPLPLVLADNTEIGMIGLNLLRLGKAYLLGYEPIPVIGKRERVFLGTAQPATINPVALKKMTAKQTPSLLGYRERLSALVSEAFLFLSLSRYCLETGVIQEQENM